MNLFVILITAAAVFGLCMDGVYLLLDTAFAGWCLQKAIDPQSYTFHDPSRSWWFPHDEEES